MPANLPDRLRSLVERLCAPECAGREAGSPEGQNARQFLVEQLSAAGLKPRTQPVPGCRGTNVYAFWPGPPSPDSRVVLIGAHYDHLGRALAPEAYWGADDNATGVAAVLELGRRFSSGTVALKTPNTTLLLTFFDGEEPPHFLTSEMGSIEFCRQPPVDLEQIDLAIVLDLVGHPLGGPTAPETIRKTLFVLGSEKSTGLSDVLESASRDLVGLYPRPLDLDVVPPLSDYEPFRKRGVPVLFLTGGRWRHYHEVTDTPDRQDYDKLAATTVLLQRLAVEMSSPEHNCGRYQPDARDWLGTGRTVVEMAAQLDPTSKRTGALIAKVLPVVEHLGAGQPLDPSQYSRLLESVAQLEQMLA